MMGVFVFATSMFLKRYLRYGQDTWRGGAVMKRKDSGPSGPSCGAYLLAVVCLTPFLSMISSSFMDIRGVLPDILVILPQPPLHRELCGSVDAQ